MDQNERDKQELQTGAQPLKGRGTMILIFGILSIVLSVVFCAILGPALGISAWVMGKKDEREILRGIIDRSELSITRAGKICGIIGTFIGIGLIILAIAMFMLIFSLISCPIFTSILTCCD